VGVVIGESVVENGIVRQIVRLPQHSIVMSPSDTSM